MTFDEKRFWSSVYIRAPHKCWIWMKSCTDGYGQFVAIEGGHKRWRAHRYAWILEHGEIPDGLVLDHICRTRACVNPAHLRVVTDRENILAGTSLSAINARKTHCKNGHEFTAENTYVNDKSHRACRICLREKQRLLRERRRWERLAA